MRTLKADFCQFYGSVLFVFVCVCVLSHAQLFVTPWTVACQASLSMAFSRQECWSGLPCFPLEDHLDSRIKLSNTCIYGLGFFMVLEEKAMAPHSSVLAWRIPMGVTQSRTRLKRLSSSSSSSSGRAGHLASSSGP